MRVGDFVRVRPPVAGVVDVLVGVIENVHGSPSRIRWKQIAGKLPNGRVRIANVTSVWHIMGGHRKPLGIIEVREIDPAFLICSHETTGRVHRRKRRFKPLSEEQSALFGFFRLVR